VGVGWWPQSGFDNSMLLGVDSPSSREPPPSIICRACDAEM
jgi:hypothetical protein